MKNCTYCQQSINEPMDFEEWDKQIKQSAVTPFPLDGREVGKRIYAACMDGRVRPIDLCNYCHSILRTVMSIEGLTFTRLTPQKQTNN